MKPQRLPRPLIQWPFVVGLGCFTLAGFVRLLGISSRPIWYDEAFSILFSAQGPTAMAYGTLAVNAAGTAADIHPLGYYTLLWGWMNAFGDSLVAVRLLSVGLGLLAAALACGLVWRVLETQPQDRFKITLLAGFFLAFSPFQVHYAQEIRMYALLSASLVGAALALWLGMQTRRWLWWVAFGVCAALAQYTHALAVVTLLPLAATPLMTWAWEQWAARQPERGAPRIAPEKENFAFARLRPLALSSGKLQPVLGTLAGGLLAVLLYLPWLIQLPAQVARVNTAYWTTRPGLGRLLTTLLTFTTNLPVPDGWLPLALFVMIFLIVLAGWQTWRAFRRAGPKPWGGLWLAWMAFAPVALLFLISQVQPVYIERALLPAGVFFLLWLAWALTGTRLPRPVMVAAIGLFFLGSQLGNSQHLWYRGFPYAPFDLLGQVAASKAVEPGFRLVHANKLTMLPLAYYQPGLAQAYIADIPGSGQDTLGLPTQQVLGLLAEESPASAAAGAGQIWFVIFAREEAEYRALGEAEHPHLAWFKTHYSLEDTFPLGDLLVYDFRHPTGANQP